MHAGDVIDENFINTRRVSDEGDQAIQAITMMRSVNTDDSANCSASASGCKGAVGKVGSGTGILRRRGKRKKDYPAAWGKPADDMILKKRTLRVYDGSKQLLKEDVMFNTAFEVRVQDGNGQNHITALDVETVNRAEIVHQYMTGSNTTRTLAEEGRGRAGLEEFDIYNVDVMKGKKRQLA